MFSPIERDYHVGDLVKIKQELINKICLGKIESIDDQENTFFFNKYVSSRETHCGIQNYHGKFEVFRTQSHEKESIYNILEKVQILKLEKYIKFKNENNEENRKLFDKCTVFVNRQYYNLNTKQFLPTNLEQEYQCKFCNDIVNPDEKLIQCKSCEGFFHVKCFTIKQSIIRCINCENQLDVDLSFFYNKKSSKNIFLKKVKSLKNNIQQNDDEFILLKKQKRQNFLKSNSAIKESPIKEDNNKMQIETEKQKPITLFKEKSINLAESPIKSAIKSPIKSPIQSLDQSFKQIKKNGKISRPFENLNENYYQRMQQAIDTFKQQYDFQNKEGVDKIRSNGKFQLFQSLIYGIQEIQQAIEQKQYLQINNEEELFKTLNAQQVFDLAQEISFALEEELFQKDNFADTNVLNDKYKQHFRTIFINLQDSKNFILRQKILSKLLSIEELVATNDTNLLNQEKKKEFDELEEKRDRVLQLPTLDQLVIKTHKEIMFLGGQNQEIIAVPSEIYQLEVSDDSIQDQFEEEQKKIENTNDSAMEIEKLQIQQQPSNHTQQKQSDNNQNGVQLYNKSQIESLKKKLNLLIGQEQKQKFIERIETHLPEIISKQLIDNFKSQ